MGITLNEPPRIQPLNAEWYKGLVAQIDMLRLDEVHPVISGNKWYKLKYNLVKVQAEGYHGVLTFGGAFSNHLIATAAAAHHYGLASVAVVRGEELVEKLSTTLLHCQQYGMKFDFVSRQQYALKTETSFLNELEQKYANYYIIPEGGANEYGRMGVEEIGEMIPEGYTHICVSVGTGTTMAGICKRSGSTEVFGYAPMKGGKYLFEDLQQWVGEGRYQLFDDWHFGGFGKHKSVLLDFMNDFYKVNDIPLDIVYTGKMMYGIAAQIEQGVFAKDAKIICIHTGGLQGNKSVTDKLDF